MILHRDGRSLASVAIVTACMLPCRVAGQAALSRATGCDSVLRGARVDSVGVTARAYLVRRDGEPLPPRARIFLIESIFSNFVAPKPLHVPVFSAGPARLRMLRRDLSSDGDSLTSREPVIYGVYDFALLRTSAVSGGSVTVPTMSPGFDESIIGAITALQADSTSARVTRALGLSVIPLQLRVSTGADDSRSRVPPAEIFTATFPRVRLVDAQPSAGNPLPEYPQEERDDGRDGEVMLRVVVDEMGAAVIRTLEVLHATSPAFALAAARALARYHFAPAHVGSCPVPQVVEIPFWFSLRP